MKTWKTILALGILAASAALNAQPGGSGASNFFGLEQNGAAIEARFFEEGVATLEVRAPGLESEMATYMVEDGALSPAIFSQDASGKVSGPGLTVKYSADPPGFSFYDRNGRLLLRIDRVKWNGDGSYTLVFAKQPGDVYYGLGEMFTGYSYLRGALPLVTDLFHSPLKLDQNGKKLEVFNAHRPPSELVLPFILNPRGYGLLIENPVKAEFDFRGRERFTYTAMGGPLKFWVIAGDSFYAIMDTYSKLTGRTPLPPRWVAGYMQSRYGYKNEAEFRALMDNFRSKDIPCDVLIFDLDWYSSGSDCQGMCMGNMDWDRSRFPDPEGLMADLEERGFKAVNIVDPAVRRSSRNFGEVRDKGLGVTDGGGNPYYFNHWGCPGALLLDYLNPLTRAWWGEKIKAIHDTGVDGWWTDKNEPEDDRDGMYYGGRPRHQGHNLQAVLQHKAMADMYEAELPDERLFIMSRTGFVGDWRYGVGIWSGDINSSWSHLARQVQVGLSAGLSGYGLWNSDVGGFHGRPTPELHARWMQFGAFCPIFRAHGNHSIREPWAFGEKTEAILREVINLRYRLAPYHYNLFRELYDTGKPPMRAMFLEFPDEPAAHGVEDQYMYGPWLLVAPVTAPLARGRAVWLPAGEWTDFWTGEVHQGPGRIWVDAPLERIPLLVRQGAILPMTELRQSIGVEPFEKISLHIFPGPEKSTYRIYDDDGETNAYRTGNFTWTPVEVIPADKLVARIGPREGSFDGMPGSVSCEVVVHRAERPSQVSVDGRTALEGEGWKYDADKKLLTLYAEMTDSCLIIEVE